MSLTKPSAETKEAVVELRGLSKSFDGTLVLDGVSFAIAPGQVHGLLGENGSGKSTLIKILSGFHAPDSGELLVGGSEVPLPLPVGRFRTLGMSFVYQDLGLIGDLSVVENVRVAEMIARRGGLISWRQERCKAREAFRRYGLDHIDPDSRIEELAPADQALVAIVRSLSEIEAAHESGTTNPGLLVLDEPTVYLAREETELLFRTVRKIVEDGYASVLLVSHDLDEIKRVTDRVSILRDGKLVGTVATRDSSESRLIEMIIGRKLGDLEPEEHSVSADVGFSVRGLATAGLKHFDADIRRGEILGLTGHAGAGFSEALYALFGARKCTSGELLGDGQAIDLRRMTPIVAMRSGLALIPADRKSDGSVGDLSMTDNVTLPVLTEFSRLGVLSESQLARRTSELINEFDIRPRRPDVRYADLSGGNQQKAMVAKWLQRSPRLILLDEPTQGVDIGARAQIFEILRNCVAEGESSIICASTDYEQLGLLCDRVMVFAGGEVVTEISGDDVTKERITQQVYNVGVP